MTFSNSKSFVNPVRSQFPEESDELNLSDVLRILFDHQGFILACVLCCFLIASLYAFFWPKAYEATAMLKLSEGTQVIQSNTVAERAIQTLHLTDQPEFAGLSDQNLIEKLLKKNVLIKVNDKDASLLMIQVATHNRQLTADLANVWAQSLIQMSLDAKREMAIPRYKFIHDQLTILKDKLDQEKTSSKETRTDQMKFTQLVEQDQEAQLLAESDDPGILLIDKAVVPENAAKPKVSLTLILGLLIGLFAGILGAFGLEKIQDRIKTEEDIQNLSGLPSLALLPNFGQKKIKSFFSSADQLSPRHLINDPQFEHSLYRESFSILKVNLNSLKASENPRTISVFSSSADEGMSIVNANLALTLSNAGKKVLLIDANFRKPLVGILFGVSLSPQTGLPLVLTGKRKIEDLIIKSQFENLWLLPNGTIAPNPSVLLGSEEFKQLIQDLKKRYDYIVVDGVSILPVSDSVVLSTVLDGVILMAHCDKTRKNEFYQALQRLRAVNAPLLGTILNGVDIKKSLYSL